MFGDPKCFLHDWCDPEWAFSSLLFILFSKQKLQTILVGSEWAASFCFWDSEGANFFFSSPVFWFCCLITPSCVAAVVVVAFRSWLLLLSLFVIISVISWSTTPGTDGWRLFDCITSSTMSVTIDKATDSSTSLETAGKCLDGRVASMSITPFTMSIIVSRITPGIDGFFWFDEITSLMMSSNKAVTTSFRFSSFCTCQEAYIYQC